MVYQPFLGYLMLNSIILIKKDTGLVCTGVKKVAIGTENRWPLFFFFKIYRIFKIKEAFYEVGCIHTFSQFSLELEEKHFV